MTCHVCGGDEAKDRENARLQTEGEGQDLMADKIQTHPACRECGWVPIPVQGALLLDVEGRCFYCRMKIPPPKR